MCADEEAGFEGLSADDDFNEAVGGFEMFDGGVGLVVEEQEFGVEQARGDMVGE